MNKIDWSRIKFYNISEDCVFSSKSYASLYEDYTEWESHRIIGLWGHGRFHGITFSHILDSTTPENFNPIQYSTTEYFNRFEILFEDILINKYTYAEVVDLINKHDRNKKLKEILEP